MNLVSTCENGETVAVAESESSNSVVRLNSKDELVWVENEIIVDSFSGRAYCEPVSVSDTLNRTTEPKRPSDKDESKLWEYFTQHNSSQLKCNLCSGVFLYQRNASHLLKHIEAAHQISVLASQGEKPTWTVEELFDNLKPEVNTNSIQSINSVGCNVEDETVKDVALMDMSKISKYFTRLESGRPRCNLCCRVLARDRYKLRMTRHLLTNHRETYLCIVYDEQEPGQNANWEIGNDGEDDDGLWPNRCRKYFCKVGLDYVQCLLCCELVNYAKGTNNIAISRHLRTKHKRLVSKRQKVCKRKVASTIRKKDPTLFVFEIIQDGKKVFIVNAQVLNETEDKGRGRGTTGFNTNRVHSKPNATTGSDDETSTNHGMCLPENKSNFDGPFSFFTTERSLQKSEHLNFEYELNGKLTVSTALHSNSESVETGRKMLRKANKGGNRAWLWKHFNKVYRDGAVCNLCGRRFSCKLGQMPKLAKHLHSVHGFVVVGRGSRSPVTSNHRNGIVNRRNAICRLFTKLDGATAECNLCHHHCSSSLSTLAKHLRRQHKHTRKYDTLKNRSPPNHQEAEAEACAPAINMKLLFDYFSGDESLRDYISFTNELIVCKLCTGMFLFNDLLDFDYTIKSHIQTCVADQSAAFLECQSVAASELEALSNASCNESE